MRSKDSDVTRRHLRAQQKFVLEDTWHQCDNKLGRDWCQVGCTLLVGFALIQERW